MKIEELMKELHKEYGDKILGSTTTEDLMLFAFKIGDEIKDIYIPMSETNEEAIEKIKILLNREGSSEKND